MGWVIFGKVFVVTLAFSQLALKRRPLVKRESSAAKPNRLDVQIWFYASRNCNTKSILLSDMVTHNAQHYATDLPI